jgi:hypothetical protein
MPIGPSENNPRRSRGTQQSVRFNAVPLPVPQVGGPPATLPPQGPTLAPLEATRNVIGTLSEPWMRPEPHAFVSLGGAPRDFWLAICRQLVALQGAARSSRAEVLRHEEQEPALVPGGAVTAEGLSTWTLENLRAFAGEQLEALRRSRILCFDVDPTQFHPVPIARLVDLWANFLDARAAAPQVLGTPDHCVALQMDQERAAMVAEGVRNLLLRSQGIGLGRFRDQLKSVSKSLYRISEQDSQAPAAHLEKAATRTWKAIQAQAQRLRQIARSLDAGLK